MNPTPLFLAALLLWAGALPAHGQPMVVADSACLKHEIDVASFATCDGDRMARPPVARITAVDALADDNYLDRSTTIILSG